MKRFTKLFQSEYIYTALTKIYIMAAGIILSALRVRFLGKDLNGRFVYINNITDIVQIFLVLGFTHAYPYYRKNRGEKFVPLFYGSTIIMSFIYVVICLLLWLILRPGFEESVVILALPLAFITIILGNMMNIANPRIRNSIQVLANTVDVIFMALLFAVGRASLPWVAVIFVSLNVLLTSFYLLAMRVRPVFSLQSFRLIKEIALYGIIPVIGDFFYNLNYKADIYMLKRSLSYEYVSIYSVGIGIANLCWAIPEAMKNILESKLVSGKKEDEICRISRYSHALILFIQLGLLIFGKLAIKIMYGGDYIPSYNIMAFAFCGTYGMLWVRMVSPYCKVEGKLKAKTFFLFICAVVNILINYILIPLYGLYGAAFASVVSYNLCGILMLAYFRKQTGIHIADMIILKKKDIDDFISYFRETS